MNAPRLMVPRASPTAQSRDCMVDCSEEPRRVTHPSSMTKRTPPTSTPLRPRSRFDPQLPCECLVTPHPVVFSRSAMHVQLRSPPPSPSSHRRPSRAWSVERIVRAQRPSSPPASPSRARRPSEPSLALTRRTQGTWHAVLLTSRARSMRAQTG